IHTHTLPVCGTAEPPPVPQEASSHRPVPKLVDVDVHGPPVRLASKLVSCSSCSGSHTATTSPSKPSAKIRSTVSVVQVTATFVTSAPLIVPLPFATTQVSPAGWVATVTA